MRLRTLLLAAVLVPAAPALADEFDGKPELTNKDKATIQADQDEQHKKIDEKYKDDNSSEARASKMREYDQADRQVLDKHGVDQHDYARQDSSTSPRDQEDIANQKKGIEDQREKDAEEAKKPKDQPAEQTPQVIKGFNEEHPLDVEGGEQPKPAEKPQTDENGNPMPTVEKLNPADDPNAAANGAPAGEGGAAPAEAPRPTRDLSNTAIRHKSGTGNHKKRKSYDQ